MRLILALAVSLTLMSPAYAGPCAQDSGEVTMFSTSWCPYCKQLRQFFAENNIDFTECDIDESDSCSSRLLRLTGEHTVPVTLACGQQVSGFDEDEFKELFEIE